MHPFRFSPATSAIQAQELVSADNQSSFLAGGTTLIDLMKLNVVAPEHLVAINKLNLSTITEHDDGVTIGALATNTDLARHKHIVDNYPLLSNAILAGASEQLRNMATVGGNLRQRTRCSYFRDPAFPCNKRQPGSGCPAIEGFNRSHAILGVSDHCIATHASDMCVALLALDAVVCTQGVNGQRKIPISEFYLLPAENPDKETVLRHGELITAIELPKSPFAHNFHYLKVRDRASYSFALASAAVAFEIQNGVIAQVRIALGGVATKPWRAAEAESLLRGKVANEANFKAAAEASVSGAKAQKHNGFKISLAKRTVLRALFLAGGLQ